MIDEMQKVSADTWADVLSGFRCYQTEEADGEGGSFMYSKLSQGEQVGRIVGYVHYGPAGGRRGYYVLKTLIESEG